MRNEGKKPIFNKSFYHLSISRKERRKNSGKKIFFCKGMNKKNAVKV